MLCIFFIIFKSILKSFTIFMFFLSLEGLDWQDNLEKQ